MLTKGHSDAGPNPRKNAVLCQAEQAVRRATAILVFAHCGTVVSGRAHGQVERWIAIPELTISQDALPGSPPYILGDVIVGPGQRLYVPLLATHEIAIFEPTGRFVRSFGEKGQGPGQFTSTLIRGSWHGDSLVIPDRFIKPNAAADFWEERLIFWDPEGRHLKTEGLSNSSSPDGCLTPFPPRAILPDGSAVVAAMYRYDCELPRTPILRINRAGHTLDTLAWLDRRNENLSLGSGPTKIYMRQVLSDESLWTVAPDARAVVIVNRESAITPDMAVFEVIKLSYLGDTLFVCRVDYEPIDVSAERLDSAVASHALYASRMGIYGDTTEARKAVQETAYLPQYWSPVSRVVAGQDGTVWIRREEFRPDSVEWNVIGANGALEARIWLPRSVRLGQAQRDAIWATIGGRTGPSRRSSAPASVIRYRIEPAN